MSYYQTQQNSLPFPLDQYMQQPMQVNQGQMHFQLNVAVHPNLQAFLPLMGTAAIDVLQSRSRDNALRTFLYNQMSVNWYQNNDFLGFIKSLGQYVEVTMFKGMYRDIPSAVMDGAVKIAELLCAENLRTFPQLANMIDPGLFQRSQASMQLSAQWANEVAAYRQASGGMQQPQMNQFPNQTFVNNSGGFGMNSAGWGGTPQPSQGGFYGNNASNQSSGVFSSGSGFGAAMGGGQTFNNAPAAPRSTYLVSPEATRPAPAPAPVSAAPVFQRMPTPINSTPEPVANDTLSLPGVPVGCTIVKASDPGVKFCPTTKYPHTIAYNAQAFDLYYIVEQDGAMKPYLKPLSQSELEERKMDQSKHFHSNNVTSASLHHSVGIGSQARTEEFLKELKKMEILPGAPDFKNDPALREELKVTTNIESMKTAISDTEIWKDSEVSLHSCEDGMEPISAHLSIAKVADMFVSVNDPTTLADKLSSCDTFVAAKSLLQIAKSTAAQLSMLEQRNAQTVVMYFNRKLTDRLQSYVKNDLSLDINIGSFMDDCVDLLDLVQKRYGDNFSEPLIVNQTRIIRDCCTYITGELLQIFEDYYSCEDVLAETTPHMTYFANMPDMFLSVNMFSCDLAVQCPASGTSVAIFAEQMPALHQLAELMFNTEKECGLSFGRRMIRTLDNVVLNVFHSHIDQHVYLVSKA